MASRAFGFLVVLSFLGAGARPAVGQGGVRGWWDDSFESKWLAGRVHVATVDGPLLYAGGDFKWVGNLRVNHVAFWDGAQWNALGGGLPTPVWAIGMHGDQVIAACPVDRDARNNESRVYAWDGSGWNVLGSTFPRRIRAIASDGQRLVVGIYGSRLLPSLYEWNAPDWTPLTGDGSIYGRIEDVEFDGDDLLITGDFGGEELNGGYLIRADETGWVVVGGDTGEYSGYEILPTSSGLVVEFGDWLDDNQLYRLVGGAWQPIMRRADKSDGICFAEVKGHLVAGASFWGFSGGVSGRDFFREETEMVRLPADREVWPGKGMWSYRDGFAFLDRLDNVAFWDAGTVSLAFTEGGGGLTGAVHDTAPTEGGFYAGGQFVHHGPREIRNIARWTGTEWKPVGDGLLGPVLVLGWHEGDLFAGGRFQDPEGGPDALVARWTGTTWELLLRTVHPYREVRRMASSPDGLYVWGPYGHRLYRDGSWTTLPETETPEGYAWHPDGLLVGTLLPVYPDERGVMQWDGVKWNTLSDAGIYRQVCVDGDQIFSLYCEGLYEEFRCAVVSWDGARWNTVSDPLPWRIEHLTAHDGRIYAAVNRKWTSSESVLYEWDGVMWNEIPSANLHVRSIRVTDESLIVAGSGTHVAGTASAGVALWHFARDSTPAGEPSASGRLLVDVAPNPANPTTMVRLNLPRSGPTRVDILDARGRLVTTLLEASVDAGRHDLLWAGVDGWGRPVSSGVYRVRVQSAGREETRPVTLVK